MKKRYDSRDKAVAAITRNGGKVGNNGVINFDNPGIKMLGAIDYLITKHNCRWVKTRD